VRSIGRLAALAAITLMLSSGAMAQSDQEIRCMQLQQELSATQGGGGDGGALADLDQQIAQQDRIYQGTQASMEDAGCYERLFIFGRALKRTPQCLNMNDRVEDARRQLARLQGQRQSLQRGGGNRRRQAELQDALQRNGCSGAPPRSGGGGLFDFFGGSREPEYQTPIYRNIDPNGRYRTICVRLCDGFYYPIHYSIYGSQVAQDAEQCQQNCAAPAELYVYRNPGQEIQQAISLSGSAYMDLPVALKYRTEYIKGCSCKQSEYNPTEIEEANKKEAAVESGGKGAQAHTAAAPPAPAPGAQDQGEKPQLNLDVTGATDATTDPDEDPVPPSDEVEANVSPPPPPASAAKAAAPAATAQKQSVITKSKPAAN
jgi:hypothetical protein